MGAAPRVLTTALLAGLTAAAVVLSGVVSIWFFVAVPFLAAGTYAAFLGLSPTRFLAAVDDDTGAAPYPF
jgi:hypothetical protein